MSIKVTIEHSGGTFRRTLDISRSPLDYQNGDAHDATNRYLVEYRGGSERTHQDVVIEHRYGDDLLTLFAEVVEALGGRGGTELKR